MSEKPAPAKHYYTRISKPFYLGSHKIVKATEILGDIKPDGTCLSLEVLLDAETRKEVTTLDLGSQVIHQQPGQATTIQPVIESDPILQRLATIPRKRLRSGEWIDKQEKKS